MDEKELFDLLGVKPEATKRKGSVRERRFKPGDAPKPFREEELSPTVFLLDKWDIRLGEDLLMKREGEALTVEEMADFHALYFLEEIRPAPHPKDAKRAAYCKALMEGGTFRALHESTTFNRSKASAAANKAADAWLEIKIKDDEKKGDPHDEEHRPPPKPIPYTKGKGKPKPPPEEDDDEEEGMFEDDLEDDDFEDDVEYPDDWDMDEGVMKAAASAVSAAETEVGEMEDVEKALAPEGHSRSGAGGTGRGAPGSPLDVDALTKLFEMVKRDPVVRNIVENAGKFRAVVQSQRRRKILHGRDDVVGVTLGGDPELILPEELCHLAHPLLRKDFIRRMVDDECLIVDYRGEEPVGRGMFVMVLDESGSMRGKNIQDAKAFALAGVYMALHQRRWCCLIGYSGGEKGNILILKPGRWEPIKVFEWLKHFYGGGSSLDLPILELPLWWDEIKPPKGRTDLIMVTDAALCCGDVLRDRFLAWRRKFEIKSTGVMLGHGDGSTLVGLCDEVHQLSSIEPTGEEVARMLSF